MAKRRKTTAKKAARAAEKAAKKNPKAFYTAVAVLLVLAIVAGVCWYFFVYKKQDRTPVGVGNLAEISSADLSVHFLELGVHNAGDCVLILSLIHI